MSSISQVLCSFGSGVSTISFESIGTPVTGNSPTVGLPSTFNTGDLLIIVFNSNSGNVTVTPSGWTAVGPAPSSPRLYIYYKIAGASESAVAMTTTGAGSAQSQAIMLAYKNNTATPGDVTSTLATGSGTATTPSITTTASNDVVLSIYTGNVNAVWTPPSGTTVRFDGGGNLSFAAILVCDESLVAAGATTSRTATNTGTSTCAVATSFKSL